MGHFAVTARLVESCGCGFIISKTIGRIVSLISYNPLAVCKINVSSLKFKNIYKK